MVLLLNGTKDPFVLHEPLDHEQLLVRLWHFAPATPVPLTVLAASTAAALPDHAPEDTTAQVLALLYTLAADGLVIKEAHEWAFQLTPAGRTTAAALSEELRQLLAMPVAQVIAEWFTLLHQGAVADASATVERLLVHADYIARHAVARGDHAFAIGLRILRGQTLLTHGDAAAAAQDAATALFIAEQLGAQGDVGRLLAHDLAGQIAYTQDDLDDALAHMHAALRALPPECDVVDVLFHALRLATALAEQERHAEVLALLKPVLVQARQPNAPDVPYLTLLLRCYGSSLVATGAYTAGLALLRDAVARAGANSDQEELVAALDDLALAQVIAGQTEGALLDFQRAAQLRRNQRQEVHLPINDSRG
jgi:tetratricopeptide (TPR) repeat protein